MRYYCVLKSFLDLPILSSESQGSLYFLHCLIFKMLLLIFGDELFYYTTFKFICQPLFRSFFKFSFLWRSLLRDSFNIISHSKFFVKYFFQVFQKTFLWPLFRFQTSFSIISHPNSFVNPFSEVFSNLFFRDTQLSLRQLFYYITFSSACQVLFI